MPDQCRRQLDTRGGRSTGATADRDRAGERELGYPAATRAPGHKPHDDEDGYRDQPDEEKRLERCKDPARSHEGEPCGEDRAEDCPDDPPHVLQYAPGPLAGTALAHRWSQPSRRQARDDRRPAKSIADASFVPRNGTREEDLHRSPAPGQSAGRMRSHHTVASTAKAAAVMRMPLRASSSQIRWLCGW